MQRLKRKMSRLLEVEIYLVQIGLHRHQCVSLAAEEESESLEQEVAENNWSAMTTELSVITSGPVTKPSPEPLDKDPLTTAVDALAAATRAVMVAALHTPASSCVAKKETGA